VTALTSGLVIPRGPIADAITQVVEADRAGVPQVWSTSGGDFDALGVMTLAAQQTSQVTVGTSIVPTYPIHPIALAAQISVFEGNRPGRLRLGIGPSHRPMIEAKFGIPMGKPLDHLREYVTVLRQLLWEGASRFEGVYYQVDWTRADAYPPTRTPILISALRQNAFRLAGEVADGAMSWIAPIPYLVNEALPAITAGAAAAARPVPPIIAHVPVAASEDRAAARAAFRAQFPHYSKLPFYQNMFAASGFPVTADQQMTDALVDELLISGSDDAIRTRLEAIHAEGIAETYISPVIVADRDREIAAISAILAG
jgi:F420-dependent oxidoreductase-like protein